VSQPYLHAKRDNVKKQDRIQRQVSVQRQLQHSTPFRDKRVSVLCLVTSGFHPFWCATYSFKPDSQPVERAHYLAIITSCTCYKDFHLAFP